jgi:hypothetical protein
VFQSTRLFQITILSPPITVNKHCSKILEETLFNRVSNELLPFVVKQSHDSFTLLSVNDTVITALLEGLSRAAHRV